VYESRDPKVRTVRVAGTFNDWNPEGVAMERQGDLWTAVLFLPRGTYEYMFVEDDAHWVTDPLALQTRDDGFGRKNAVLDLTL
jgi:1,4-alpha-glucan branching enzyme